MHRSREWGLPAGSGLLAGAAAGGFEAIHLCIALAAEMAVSGLSVLLFARTVEKSGMRIDPHLYAWIALETNRGCGSLGESEADERPLPGSQRCPLWRTRRRPQHGQHSHHDGRSQIDVSTMKTQLHPPVPKAAVRIGFVARFDRERIVAFG